jgi:gluconate 5-dehydrogenase
LADRTVLLTGSTGFLGRTFARTLLANGARLIAVGRSERLHTEGDAWTREFGVDRVRVERIDMSDVAALSMLLDRLAIEERIDVLVNNAFDLSKETGFNVPTGTLEHATFEQWSKSFTGGVYWAALSTQKIGAGMKLRGKGSIVNISTMYAMVAPDPKLYEDTSYMNPPGYSAAKAGLLALTRYTASFWGRFGVRCNAILPGPFSNTQETTENSVRADDPFLARVQAKTCLGRTGRPDELAGAILFLASDASSFMTGQGLVIDGGWTAV